MGSQKKLTRTLMYNIPVITVLFSLSWVVGMVVYAVYSKCDPLSAGYIDKFDEILPFFVEDRFSYLPGILGLFMASLFNGALSLNVSIINSLATVVFEDFVAHIPIFRDLKDSAQVWAIKIIGTVVSLIIMGMAFGIANLDGVIESSMLVTSATSGQLLGVFIMAMLIPAANWKGASLGVIVGHIVILWITFGGLTVHKEAIILPLDTSGCSNSSFNDHILKPEHRGMQYWTPTTTPAPVNDYITTRAEKSNPLTAIYSISYMYYSFIGCFITVLIGWTVSYFTASESDTYDRELIHPIARKMADYLPGKKRRYAKTIVPKDKTMKTSASSASIKSGSANPSFVGDEKNGKRNFGSNSIHESPSGVSLSKQNGLIHKSPSNASLNKTKSISQSPSSASLSKQNGSVNHSYSHDMPMEELPGSYRTKL